MMVTVTFNELSELERINFYDDFRGGHLMISGEIEVNLETIPKWGKFTTNCLKISTFNDLGIVELFHAMICSKLKIEIDYCAGFV